MNLIERLINKAGVEVKWLSAESSYFKWSFEAQL